MDGRYLQGANLGTDKVVERLRRHTDRVGRWRVELVGGMVMIGRDGRGSSRHKTYVLVVPQGWWTRGRGAETKVMVSHPLGVGGTGNKLRERETGPWGNGHPVSSPPCPFYIF